MSLHISVTSKQLSTLKPDVIIIPIAAGGRILTTLSAEADKELHRFIKEQSFQGEWGRAHLFLKVASLPVPFVAVVGLGDVDEQPSVEQTASIREAMRRGMGHVVQDVRRHGLHHVVLQLGQGESTVPLAEAATEGVMLTNYAYTEHSARLKAKHERQRVTDFTILVDRSEVTAVQQAVTALEALLQGVMLARDLVNRPSEHMSPKALVEVARRIARSSKQISVKVLNREQAKRAGFTAFLAVAQGSELEPYVIHLQYTPKQRRGTKRISLVGKGITFDSGGLSLKPADFMENMKIDMAGAATVLGVFQTMVDLQPAIAVDGIIAACENMPSGSAYRPGDVVRAMNGTTIEIINTDAEGRVTLADTLSYAVKLKPDAIIDVATLTGAAMVGLGETVAGLWSTDERLGHAILQAGEYYGEQMALLPMPQEYHSLIESQVADLRNMATSRFGGAITAAMFLREFVNDTPWAHLDVAGPSYLERPYLSYFGRGATGFGVRTLWRVVQTFANTDLLG